MQSRPLVIVVDNSGSMRELGKAALARTLVDHIRETIRLSERSYTDDPSKWPTIHVIIWSAETQLHTIGHFDELPPYEPQGRAQAEPLRGKLEQVVPTDSPALLMWLGDGYWGQDEIRILRRWRKTRPQLLIRVIAVGADADLRAMQRLADAGELFLAEDIGLALETCSRLGLTPLPERSGEFLTALPGEME